MIDRQLSLFGDMPRQSTGALVAFPLERNRREIRRLAERLAKVSDGRLADAIRAQLMPLYTARIAAGFAHEATEAELSAYGTQILIARNEIVDAREALIARSAPILDIRDAQHKRGGMPPATPSASPSNGKADAPRRRRPRTQAGGHPHA